MTFEVKQVTEVTEPLLAAFARLLPQLSPRLAAVTRQRLQSVLSAPSTVLFVAQDADQLVGALTLTWYVTPSGCKAWIEDVVVDAAARGCGVGEKLVHAALAHASKIGAERVCLTSNATRTAARALYRKMGFEEAATTVFVYKIK
ncbi:MAG: GNAT family N-acetyltransferase [Alistipes sp.]